LTLGCSVMFACVRDIFAYCSRMLECVRESIDCYVNFACVLEIVVDCSRMIECVRKSIVDM
jgi:hypothetical protein